MDSIAQLLETILRREKVAGMAVAVTDRAHLRLDIPDMLFDRLAEGSMWL